MPKKFEKKQQLKAQFFKNTKKNLESVKMNNSKIGLRHVLSWPKWCIEPKCHEVGTFGGFGKREQADTQTDTQDSCFISI